MKLAVIGSRDFDDYEYMKAILEFHPCKTIISGGATGADKLAERYARENNLGFKDFLPNWKGYGKSAGAIRNKKIVDASDEVVAFWDKKSPGTKITVDFAEAASKPVYIYWSDERDSDWIDTIGIGE